MRLLIYLSVLFLQFNLVAQSIDDQPKMMNEALQLYTSGRFQTALEKIIKLESDLELNKSENTLKKGLFSYWKGMIHNRLQDFPAAIENFEKAIKSGYFPKDIYYEYGQALYASEKLAQARSAFKDSYKKGFKKGICLYYLAYLTQSLGDYKKAIKLYKSIEKLPADEQKDVFQPAHFAIGDLYLKEAERRPDAISSIENYVLPQYQKAYDINPDSELALQIKTKMREVQQKYDLVLFQLRNGRPTLVPPYFLRLAQDISYDNNVIFAAQETDFSSSDTSSLVSKTDVLGRYTFYYKNLMGISPELRMNYSRYLKREPLIYKNDNTLIAPAIRTNYEYSYKNKPAAVLFDIDYAYVEMDLNSKEDLVFSNRALTFMIGNKVNLINSGETIFRLRRRGFSSYNPDSDSTTNSFVIEQIMAQKSGQVFVFIFNYDRTRVKNELFDTDVFSLRSDLIFPRYKDLFTPSVGLALNTTDPINDRDNRGREFQFNPNFKLSKTFQKRYRANFNYNFTRNVSKDKDSFDFKRQIYGLELEYLF